MKFFLELIDHLTQESCMSCYYQLRWRIRYMTDEDLANYYETGLCHKCYKKEYEDV